MMRNRFKQFLIAPFRSENGTDRPLVIIFLLINGVVLFNAIFHHPAVGPDSPAHLRYIEVLSQFRLPTPDDTYEFFSPPLPYLLPSLLYSSGIFSLWGVAKFSQLLNALFSAGLTFYLVKICDLIRPNHAHFAMTSLAFMGMLPVYYKTFAFVRGEPLLAFLAVFVVYQTLVVFVEDTGGLRNLVVLGVSLGLLILARQWGFFLFPAIGLFLAILLLKQKQKWLFYLKTMMMSFCIAFMVGGWFYIYLYKEYGTVKAFNRPPHPTFSFSNQPGEFYVGLGLDKLFTDPIRDAFPNQFFPRFYSEFWGDYACYFLVYGRDARNGQFRQGWVLESNLFLAEAVKEPPPWWLETNRYKIRGYLGRVNLVSLFPSAILLAGLILGMVYFGRFVGNYRANDRMAMYALLCLVIVISIVGYFWFLIRYPSPSSFPHRGDTIKALYLLQIYPFVSIFAGEFLQRVKQKSIHVYQVISALLAISLLHNFPTFITRYTPWH